MSGARVLAIYTISFVHAPSVPTDRTARPCRPGARQISITRRQSLPRTPQTQSDSGCRSEAQVNFARLNLLQIPSRNLRPLRQLFLRQAPTQALTAHTLAERPYSRPLFLSETHPILSPAQQEFVNDTHIVKCTPEFSPTSPSRGPTR